MGIEPTRYRGGPSSSIAHADGDATAADPKTDTASNPQTDTGADTTTNASAYSRANPESNTGCPARAGRTAGRRERLRHTALCR